MIKGLYIMSKPLKWNDMTPEEKDELRERLDKAGIPKIGRKGHTRLSRSHMMSTNDYYLMLEEQNGKCMICEEHYGFKLVVDHNHSTGKIRGLLCKRCNILVGIIEGDKFHPSLIEKIKRYLKKTD